MQIFLRANFCCGEHTLSGALAGAAGAGAAAAAGAGAAGAGAAAAGAAAEVAADDETTVSSTSAGLAAAAASGLGVRAGIGCDISRQRPTGSCLGIWFNRNAMKGIRINGDSSSCLPRQPADVSSSQETPPTKDTPAARRRRPHLLGSRHLCLSVQTVTATANQSMSAVGTATKRGTAPALPARCPPQPQPRASSASPVMCGATADDAPSSPPAAARKHASATPSEPPARVPSKRRRISRRDREVLVSFSLFEFSSCRLLGH